MPFVEIGMHQDTKLWKEYKEKDDKIMSISAGCLSAVLGLAKNKSRMALWKEKKGMIKKNTFISEAQQHGHDEEPFSRKLFEKLMGVTVGNTGTITKLGIFPEIKCSPDGIFIQNGKICGLEIKNPFSRDIPFTVDELDVEYYPQIMLNQYITEMETWYLMFTRRMTNEYAIFKFTNNAPFFEKVIMPKIIEFQYRTNPPPRISSKEKNFLGYLVKRNIKVELVMINKGTDEL